MGYVLLMMIVRPIYKVHVTKKHGFYKFFFVVGGEWTKFNLRVMHQRLNDWYSGMSGPYGILVSFLSRGVALVDFNDTLGPI